MGCVFSSASGTCYCCVQSNSENWNRYASKTEFNNPAEPKGWGLGIGNYAWFYHVKDRTKEIDYPHRDPSCISRIPSGECGDELSDRRSPLPPFTLPPLPATPNQAYNFLDREIGLGPPSYPKFKRFGTYAGKRNSVVRFQLENEDEEIYRAHSDTYEMFQPDQKHHMPEITFNTQPNIGERRTSFLKPIIKDTSHKPLGITLPLVHGCENSAPARPPKPPTTHSKGMAPLPPKNKNYQRVKTEYADCVQCCSTASKLSKSNSIIGRPIEKPRAQTPPQEVIDKGVSVSGKIRQRSSSVMELRSPPPQMNDIFKDSEEKKLQVNDIIRNNSLNIQSSSLPRTLSPSIHELSKEAIIEKLGSLPLVPEAIINPIIVQKNKEEMHVENKEYTEQHQITMTSSGVTRIRWKTEEKPPERVNGDCVSGGSASVSPVADGNSMDGAIRHLTTRGGDGINKNTPLHLAAKMGCINCLRWMIEEEGGDKNCMDSDGRTPLHLVAKKGHTEATKYLLSIGSSLMLDRQGKSPVNYAAENEQMECLSLLIVYGTGSRDKGEFRLKDETANARCTCQQNLTNNDMIEVEKNSTLNSTDSLSPVSSSSPSPFPSPVHQPFFLHPPRSPCRNNPSSDDVYVPAQSDPGTHATTPPWMEALTETNKLRSNTLNVRGGTCGCRPGWKSESEPTNGFFLHKQWQEECRAGSVNSDRCRDLFNGTNSVEKKQIPSSSQSESESGSESGYAEIGEDYKNKRFIAQVTVEENHRSSVTSDTSYSELSDAAVENDYEDIYIAQQNGEQNKKHTNGENLHFHLSAEKGDEDVNDNDSESPESIPPPPEFDDATLRQQKGKEAKKKYAALALSDPTYTNQTESSNPPPPPPPPPAESPVISTPPSPALSISEANKKLLTNGFHALGLKNGNVDINQHLAWFDARKFNPRPRSQSVSSDDYVPSVPHSICEDDVESNADSESGRESNGFAHSHRPHLLKNQQLFIPPQFPNPTESDCLIKPSEYLKSISKNPQQNRLPMSCDSDDNEDARSTASSIARVLPAIPETDDFSVPPPPPPPAASSSPCPSPVPQVLAAISVQEIASVQLKKTNNKLSKTLSAPVTVKTDESATYQQKTDLIAELKQSKDILGIRKLKEERALVEEKNGKQETEEFYKQFTAEAFFTKVPEVDVGGNPIPNWKRMMMARKAAERARQEAEERRERDREEKRMQAIPPWKRQLLQRKEKDELRRSTSNLSLNFLLDDKPRSSDDSDVNKENELDETESNPEQKYEEGNESETLPIMPWRAQLRKTNSKLNLNE